MTRLLADFTTDELDALPVGSQFIDAADDDPEEWVVTKTGPQQFTGPMGSTYTSAEVKQSWTMDPEWSYTLEAKSEPAEAPPTLHVHPRSSDWHACIDGDLTRWGCGKTVEEAVAATLRTHHIPVVGPVTVILTIPVTR